MAPFGSAPGTTVWCADGRLWFSTIAGAAIIDPRMPGELAAPPPLVIEEVLADGRRIIRVDIIEDTAGALRLFLRFDFSKSSRGSLGFFRRVFLNPLARTLYFAIDELDRALIIAELPP